MAVFEVEFTVRKGFVDDWLGEFPLELPELAPKVPETVASEVGELW